MAAALGIATLMTKVDLAGLNKGINQGKATTKSGFSSMGDLAKGALATGVAAGAALAVKAVADFAKESVAEFQTFEKQAAEVFTLMPGLSQAAMDSMKDDVLSFSAEAGRTTDETLPALYQAISAGVPAENVFDFMKIASDAALGGVTDLETAVDGITSVTNAYGSSVIDAATASDVMFTAVRLGKTDFTQLSSSLFNVIPTAASLGVTFTDVAANLAALTAQGTPTSVATTQLRSAFVEASKSGTKFDQALQHLTGKTFSELIASGKTSSEIFTELRASMPEQDFRNLFSSVEAANAVMGLTNDTAAGIIESFGDVGDTLGATAAAAETMANTMEHLENRADAATEAFKIQAGASLEPLKKSYLEAKIAAFDFATVNHALNAALRDGKISSDDLNRIQTRMAFTSYDAADAMAELERMTGETGKAVKAASDHISDFEANNRAAAAAARDAAQATQEQAEAMAYNDQLVRDVNRSLLEFGGNLGATTQELEDQAYATGELAGHDEALSSAIANLNERQEAEAEAALVAAEAQRQHEAALGGYFNAAITATGEAQSLEMQLYNTAVASGAGAAELAVLAAATGEFTQAEIDAAFQAALMQNNIDLLIQSMQAGAISADEATQALGLLKDGTYDTAAAAINYVGNIDNATAAMSDASLAAEDLSGKISALPTQKTFTYTFKTDTSQYNLPPGVDPGDTRVTAGGVGLASGGFTGWAGENDVAGIVHGQELVVPAPALRAGAAGILDFANSNVPGGIGSVGAGTIINIDARGTDAPTVDRLRGIVKQELAQSGRRADVRIRTG